MCVCVCETWINASVWKMQHVYLLINQTSSPAPPPPLHLLCAVQLQEGPLVVRHFQFLRWSPYRDVPDSKKAFLSLLAQVHNWQEERGEGRTVVHCL